MPGEHLCLRFISEVERQAIVSVFVRDGLVANDKVVCLAGIPPAMVGELLRGGGMDPAGVLSSGQLSIIPAEYAYPPAAWERTIAPARDEGYRGLRICSELSGALRSGAGAQWLLEYETALDRVVDQGMVTVICQYDRWGWSSEQLRELCAVHTADVSLPDGFANDVIRISPLGGSVGVRIDGELDGYSAPLLAEALEAFCGDDGEVHLDLAGLQFADLNALRVLVLAAQDRPPGGCLVLDSPPAHLLRLLQLIGWDSAPGLVLDGSAQR